MLLYYWAKKTMTMILSNSARKLVWFEISKMLIAVLKIILLRYFL